MSGDKHCTVPSRFFADFSVDIPRDPITGPSITLCTLFVVFSMVTAESPGFHGLLFPLRKLETQVSVILTPPRRPSLAFLS